MSLDLERIAGLDLEDDVQLGGTLIAILAELPRYETAGAVVNIIGLPREIYDALPGGHESLAPCSNPDHDHLVWAKDYQTETLTVRFTRKDES